MPVQSKRLFSSARTPHFGLLRERQERVGFGYRADEKAQTVTREDGEAFTIMARKALKDGRQEIIRPERRKILAHDVTRDNESGEVEVSKEPLDIIGLFT